MRRAKKYLILAYDKLDDMQQHLNEGADAGYRLVTMLPVYVPTLFSQKLHGYVAVMELIE